MENAGNRPSVVALSWFKEMRSRYGALIVALCILSLGVLLVLLVQPSPLTFAEGWSAPRKIDEVQGGHPHRAVIDGRSHIHLAWEKRENRRDVAYYARLDRHGQWIDGPTLLSDPGVNAENVAIVLTQDDTPLCFWIEKGHQDGTQRLMMARPNSGHPSETLSTSSKIMRDLAVTGDEQGRTFLAWSDNREGYYDIYMAAFDSHGSLAIAERRITDSGTAFLLEPALAVGGNVMHLAYFAGRVVDQELVHQAYNVTGEPLSEPQVLESVAQSAASLGGGSQSTYPLVAVAGPEGQLRLYEELGPLVRQRVLGRDGSPVVSPEPLLMGSQHYSGVSLVRRGNEQGLVWADLRWGSGDRFQVYTASLDQERGVVEETRLTFASSSALWPTMLLGDDGGQHVIWQQNAGPYTYQMFYSNNLDPARISIWQRLGFSDIGGGWSFVMALLQGAILAVITAIINVWRLAAAWVVAMVVWLAARRVDALKPYANPVTWVLLLVALFVLVRPETQTLMVQMPVVIIEPSRWVIGLVASVLALYWGWVWRASFRNALIWAGIGGLWLWTFYFLNLTLVLREGFAV